MNNFVADQILQKVTIEMQWRADIVDRLHQKGYKETFEVFEDLLRCASNNHFYKIEDFEVQELHSMEDASGLKGFFLFGLHHRIEGFKGIFLGQLDEGFEFEDL